MAGKKKGNEVLIPAATWINLENIMLCETSPSQKTTYCRFHLHEMSTRGTIETKISKSKAEKEGGCGGDMGSDC